MRTFFVFRSDIRGLEDYHQYTTLEDFKNNCWDFYLLLPLWLLENNYFDQVFILRLKPENHMNPIEFDVNGKKYTQLFLNNFDESFKLPKPEITFWRGGFQCYDKTLMKNKKFFGLNLYLGASKRMFPIYGGQYDKILLESELELNLNRPNTIPFYKTANPRIFKPIKSEKIYDICWPNNFTQIKYKGQEFFLSTVGACPYLKKLKILHVGNKENIGQRLCEKYNIKNVQFVGKVSRHKLNTLLNQCKIGLVTSNMNDGCPRISTEILSSGTPLVLRKTTRLLSYYKEKGVITFSDKMMIKKIKVAVDNYIPYREELQKKLDNELSFNKICKLNIDLWNS